jgi:hypothetical protein
LSIKDKKLVDEFFQRANGKEQRTNGKLWLDRAFRM